MTAPLALAAQTLEIAHSVNARMRTIYEGRITPPIEVLAAEVVRLAAENAELRSALQRAQMVNR